MRGSYFGRNWWDKGHSSERERPWNFRLNWITVRKFFWWIENSTTKSNQKDQVEKIPNNCVGLFKGHNDVVLRLSTISFLFIGAQGSLFWGDILRWGTRGDDLKFEKCGSGHYWLFLFDNLPLPYLSPLSYTRRTWPIGTVGNKCVSMAIMLLQTGQANDYD